MISEAKKWKTISGDGTLANSEDRSETPENRQDVEQCGTIPLPETDRGWGASNGSLFGSPSHGSRGSASTGESFNREEQGSGSEYSPLGNLPVELHAFEETASVETVQSLFAPASHAEHHSPDRYSGLKHTHASHSNPILVLTVQEACLLRHFIEEISPWVSCHSLSDIND